MKYNATNDTLTILKFFEKYKGYWFNATAISNELNMHISRVKEFLPILVSRGFIEHDNYFYRFKENKQEMISAEEVRKYQKEQKQKIKTDVIFYMIAIKEAIKENMIDSRSCTGIIYEFDKKISAESLEKILKILKYNGYDVKSISPSHYYEFGGIIINW